MKASKLETFQKTVTLLHKNLQYQVRSVQNTVKLWNGLKYLNLRCYWDASIFRLWDSLNLFLLIWILHNAEHSPLSLQWRHFEKMQMWGAIQGLLNKYEVKFNCFLRDCFFAKAKENLLLTQKLPKRERERKRKRKIETLKLGRAWFRKVKVFGQG